MEDYLGHRSCQEPEPSQCGDTDHVDLSHRPFQEILDNLRNLPDPPIHRAVSPYYFMLDSTPSPQNVDPAITPPSEDEDYDGDVISAVSPEDIKLPNARLYPTRRGGAMPDPFASSSHRYSYRTLAFMYSLAENSWGVWKHSDSDRKRGKPLEVYGEWDRSHEDLGPMSLRIVAIVEKPMSLSSNEPALSTEDVMDAQRQAFAAIKEVMTKMIDTLESGVVKLEHDEVERYRVVDGEPVLHNEDGSPEYTNQSETGSSEEQLEKFAMSTLEELFGVREVYHPIDPF